MPKDKRKATDDARPLEKRVFGGAGAGAAAAPVEAVYIPAPAPKAAHLPPNKLLFAQNLPPDATVASLTRLFEP